MESQPQNPEFRINPENFHPCILKLPQLYSWSYEWTVISVTMVHHFWTVSSESSSSSTSLKMAVSLENSPAVLSSVTYIKHKRTN